ncbi:MAG TPA: ATP-binding protein [Baekduia sp.]
MASELDQVLPLVGTAGTADDFESETLDFKRVASNFKETLTLVADAAVCFANARGGTIVLGIDDKASERATAMLGVDASYTIDVIRRGIFDRTSPPLTVFANERVEEGTRLVVIHVPAGVQFVSSTAGTTTRRLGKECRPFTASQQREVLIARGQLDWSAEASEMRTEAAAPTEVERLRRLLRRGGYEDVAELTGDQFLNALRLIAPDGRMTNAGALLLADDEDLRRLLPQHDFSYQYRPSQGSEATNRFRSSRSLLSAIETVIDAVELRLEHRPLSVAGGVQLDLVDYPSKAVRELVVNAFIHRSYQTNGSVDVEHSPERLVISSPGGLVAGVTQDNILTHPSTPRNRLLSEVIAMCRLAEKTGQGIDRAYREMLSVGKEPPSIEDDGLRVRAQLSGGIGNDTFVRFVKGLPDPLARDLGVLIALALLRTKSTIDAMQLAEGIQRSAPEAQAVLSKLADDEAALLEPTRRTIRKAFPSYRLRNAPLAELARAVSYRRRTLDEIDAKVVEHIEEYGFVTNRTLQRLFDIHLYAARNMLADLRERGIVDKIGAARGGPGVRYGPGPKFPGKRQAQLPLD